MKWTLMSNKKRIFIPIIGFGSLIVVSFIHTSSVLHAASIFSPSLSIGLPNKGALKNGEVLPRTGDGYRLMTTARSRKARFGVSELVMLVKHATFKVSQKYKGADLAVGDLSTRTGGKFDHHASHQNGRDVDLGFYALSANNRSVSISNLIPFDKNGFSIKPAMKYKFDVTRNWALIQNLVESHHATVQWIFVAAHLETLMIEHAKSIGASPQMIFKAEQMMKQPSKSAHWDHFHVRIYCPNDDKPHCKDFGPMWSWAK